MAADVKYKFPWKIAAPTLVFTALGDGIQVLLFFLSAGFAATGLLAPLAALAQILSVIVGIVLWLVLILIMVLRNTDFISGKRALARTLTVVGALSSDIAPLIGAIPVATASTYYVISTSRKDDEEKHALRQGAEQKALQQQLAQQKKRQRIQPRPAQEPLPEAA